MQGKRVYPNSEGRLLLQNGDYGKDNNGHWWARPPIGSMGDLGNHEVKENEDGTITVSPSILIQSGEEQTVYHGYLVNGIWTD